MGTGAQPRSQATVTSFHSHLLECSSCAPGMPFFWAELGWECSQSLGELQVVQHLHHTGKVFCTGREGDSDNYQRMNSWFQYASLHHFEFKDLTAWGEKKEKKKKENHCFHDPQSDESINYPFFFSSRGRKQHIVLSSYQSLPPSQDATVGGARRDTNTESGWVGGRTSWWWWKDQHLFIYLQDDRGGRAPAETGLIFLQFWGTLWFVTSVVSPSAKNLVNG